MSSRWSVTFRWVVVAGAVACAAATHAQTNLAAASAGGRLVHFSSQYNDSEWAARHLIDGSSDSGWAGMSQGPQVVVLAFRGDALAEIEDVVINPYTREDAANWVREIEVQVSTSYPFRDYRSVGRWTVEPEGRDQVFTLEKPTPARYVKVLLLANGGGGYMEAGEIRVLGTLVADAPPAPAYRELHTSAAIERFSSQYDDDRWAAANLLAPSEAPGQWAGKSDGPQEIVVALAEPAVLTDVAIDNYAREAPKNWATRVEVEVSESSPYKGFEAVGALTLPAVGDLHTVTLAAPKPVRYVRVLFRGNGGGGYMEAGRIRLYAVE